jgi:gliding motility-associated-like protein
LIATNANGSDTIFVPNAVFVYPQPVANALANDVCLGSPTEFTDASLHATSWNWDFGDGNTSTIQNPSHTYADTGTYTITLNITGLGGCSDSYSFTVRVTQVPTAAFSFTDNPDCNKNTVTFTNNSTNATSYLWDLGDGTFSSDTNPVHEYTSSRTYVVKLTAFAGNCEVQTQQIINVTLLPSPTVDISGPSYALTSDDVLIQVSVTGANDATIDLGDGRTITQTAPFSDITTRYENDGDYVVTLTASNGICTSQDTFHIKVEFPEVITIPNAFTPNSDGLNDSWYPIIVGSDNYETVIYDRWGIHITTLKPNDKWDGKFNGKPCAEGVYFYNLTGTFKKGKKFKRTGSITLIR